MAGPDNLRKLIHDLPGATIAAKLRALMPDLDQRIRQGVTHEELLKLLQSQGFDDLNLATFRSNLYRYRKSLAKKGTKPRPEASTPTHVPDGNPERAAAEDSDSTQTDTPANLDDILDAQRRGNLGDKYTTAHKPIFGRRK